MAQQFTDRAYETCTVDGLNDVVLTGVILGYQAIPAGDSVCVIVGYTSSALNGEWEVARGVRTGSTFTRDAVVDSSNGGAKVTFTGDTEIAVVLDSEAIEELFLVAYTANANAIQAIASAATANSGVASNLLLIQSNDNDISALQGDTTQNTSDIAANLVLINANAANIATNVTEIAKRVDMTDTDAQTMVGELILPDATLAAIDEIVQADAVNDVFLYVPAIHDDDNGAWIESANYQSWYHEALNTGVRGATKAFPKIALLVAETHQIIIYDASKSDCPMWMMFNTYGGSISLGGAIYATASYLVLSIRMLNGKLYFGSVGVGEIDFITEQSYGYANAGPNKRRSINKISERNDPTFWITDDSVPEILNLRTTVIAVTSDGQGGNILYAGTGSGLSRIAPDDSVSNWTDTQASTNNISSLTIYDGYVYFFTNTSASGLYGWSYPANLPLESDVWNDRKISGGQTNTWAVGRLPIHHYNLNAVVNDMASNILGTNSSLVMLYPDNDDAGNSMLAVIDTKSNSGLMQGDIRGAWLASVDASSLVGVELITNGDFSVALGAEWVAHNSGVLSIVSGALRVTNGAAAFGSAVQSFATVVGESYVLTFDTVNASANLSMRLSTNDASGGTGDIIDEVGTLTNNTSYDFTFIATATTLYLRLFGNGVSGNFFEFDNVSIRLADADRSYNDDALAVYGTILRTVVKTGAELVWYSGWSGGNYLKQENNSNLDFGTGDFYIAGWFNALGTVSTDYIIDRYNGGSEARFAVYISASGTISLTTFDGSNTTTYTSTITYDFLIPTFFMIRRLSNDTCLLMLDNKIESISGTTRDVDSIASLKVGVGYNLANTVDGSLALLRIGAGAPTDEQALFIYEKEKAMFAENTKCSLQGTSNDIKSVDHDETNNIATACSGVVGHVTRFNDLVVVDDWVEEATSVSTENGQEVFGL